MPFYQTTRLQLEGSYKSRSVCLSVCLSVLPQVHKFSRNWLISFFLKLSMVLGVHIWLYVTKPDFCKNSPAKMTKNYPAKITKNDQKWCQNRVFGLFKKIASLVLSWICVKQMNRGNKSASWNDKVDLEV